MPVPPTLPDLSVLELAASCRLLTRDAVVAATGVRYNLADRTLLRLSGRSRPYLRRSRRRLLPDGGLASQWFTLRREGAERLQALGGTWSDEVLATRLKQIERLHHPRSDARTPVDVGMVERAALLSAVLIGAADECEGIFGVSEFSPGEDLGLWVGLDEMRATIDRFHASCQPDWKGGGGSTVPVTPAFHARMHFQAGTTDLALLVFVQLEASPAGRLDVLKRVARACVLAPSIERDGEVGPHHYGVDCRVRILVWFPTYADEVAFFEDARALKGLDLSRVWTTCVDFVPLAGSGPKRTRHEPLWTAREAAATAAWVEATAGGDRRPLTWVAGAPSPQVDPPAL